MNRNEIVITELKSLGFPMPEIRKALLKLNRITYPEIVGETKIGLQTIKKYIEGGRYDLDNQRAIAIVIDRFVEKEEERKAADLLLMKVQQEPDKWQAEINKIEAGHRTIFVARWRPFIGWICGSGLAFHFIIFPLLEWTSKLSNKPVTAPQIEVGALITLVTALLGLGVTRTYKKKYNLAK